MLDEVLIPSWGCVTARLEILLQGEANPDVVMLLVFTSLFLMFLIAERLPQLQLLHSVLCPATNISL